MALGAAVALLVPTWLIAQWDIATEHTIGGHRPLGLGLLFASLCYLSAHIADQQSPVRRTLVWIGGIAVFPCAALAIAFANDEFRYYSNTSPVSLTTRTLFWIVAILAPLLLALGFRGRAAWVNLVAAFWAYALIFAAARVTHYNRYGYPGALTWKLFLYLLCGIGSVGLIAWGLHEKRKERINLGLAAFAISVLFFCFDSFMGKLGRSFSLLLLGLICILGGYALEVTRRRLLARMETAS